MSHLRNLVRGLPDLRVAVTQDLRQQLRGLLEAATQFIQLLLHGEDTLLQLPIGVVPIGTEVTHDHLHLLKPAAQSIANNRKTLRGPTKAISLSSFVASLQMLHIISEQHVWQFQIKSLKFYSHFNNGSLSLICVCKRIMAFKMHNIATSAFQLETSLYYLELILHGKPV